MAISDDTLAQRHAGGGSEELQLLARKQITLANYLQRRAERSVEHLRPLLSAEDYRFLRELAYSELQTDPDLVEEVQRATGASPDDWEDLLTGPEEP